MNTNLEKLKRFYQSAVETARRISQKAGLWLRPLIDRVGPFVKRIYQFLRPLLDRLAGNWQKVLIRAVLIVGIGLTLLTGGVFIRFLYDRAEISASLEKEKLWLRGSGDRPAKPLIQIFANDDTLIGEYLPQRESRIPLDACKSQLVWLSRAAVSAEDRDFHAHGGVSYRGIFRAFANNLRFLSVREGGGSITQQVARNLYISRSTPGLIRKIYETFTAWLIESRLEKNEILCLYLNRIYMGEGRLGAEEASWFYFRKPPMNLDAAEAAMIVGLFPSPVRYSPLNNIQFSLRKQEKVLAALERDGWIKPGESAGIIRNFKSRYEITDTSPGKIGLYGASRDFRLNSAPAANDRVRQFLYETIPEEIVREGGLIVRTTIDPLRQAAALESMRKGIERVRGEMVKQSKRKDFAMQQSRRLNGTLVAMDARTGELRALVGGYGVVETGSSDRIWKMQRQPGSAIKGFLYATALDADKIDFEAEVIDQPINIGGYQPRNSYGTFKGRLTLRQAVALSCNTVAVQTLHELGASTFRDRIGTALEMSFFDTRERFPANLTLALGSGELTPLEMTRLYAILLNEGYTVRPTLIKSVTDKSGSVIWQTDSNSGYRVLSERASAQALDLLRGVVDPEDEGTAGWIGQQRIKNPAFLPFPVAGKSGTVQTVPEVARKFPGLSGVHDAWFVGLVPGEVAVVWIGQDEGAPFPGGGSGTAGSIWADYAHTGIRSAAGDFPAVEKKKLDPRGSDPNSIIPLEPVPPPVPETVQ
ncbi:MAG: transglycosylase domain-containing protein [Spirochaetia bacterium]|nr:transglycosylase domain-containing protein [Spirochaetia bacterium]